MIRKFVIWGAFLFIFLAFNVGEEGRFDGVTSINDPNANGKLKFTFKEGKTRVICPNVKVVGGMYKLCGKEKVEPEYFIERNKYRGVWFNKLFRVYDYFPPIKTDDEKKKWFEFETRHSRFIKEDFKAYNQKAGQTFTHHESSKGWVSYRVANLLNPIAENSERLHQNYDWDENISGRYELFYTNGKKKLSHKYFINRYMVLDQNLDKSKQKYWLDIKLNGSVKEYHSNFKKKMIMTYEETYSVEKKIDEKTKTIKKSKRSAHVKEFHTNGKLYREGDLVNGLEDGEWKEYNEKAILIKKYEYSLGSKHGKFIEYYPDSRKVAKRGVYINGKPSGEWEKYDSEGKKTVFTP